MTAPRRTPRKPRPRDTRPDRGNVSMSPQERAAIAAHVRALLNRREGLMMDAGLVLVDGEWRPA